MNEGYVVFKSAGSAASAKIHMTEETLKSQRSRSRVSSACVINLV